MSDFEYSDHLDSDDTWLSDDLDFENTSLSRCMKIEDIWAMQCEMASQAADALAIPTDLAFFWLNMNKWCKQELLNAFVQTPEKYTQKFCPSKVNLKATVVCPLCTERSRGLDLGCGHGVCSECFDQYLNFKIADGDIFNAVCPGNAECRNIIGPSKAVDYPQYRETAAQVYLRFQRRIKGCPTPDCKWYHELHDAPIDCECGAKLCGHCGYLDHKPASCELVEKWLKLLQDDRDTLLKVTVNTKPCPQCKVIIEKQIGCNHITCACGHEFCWQCLGQWVNYGHQCARYQDPAKKKSTQKRFAHYAPRYAANIAASAYHYSLDSDALGSARGLIAWTYVLLFYMTHSNQRTLLEDNLVNLEQASERLIEYSRKGSKEQTARLTSYVNERTATLLAYTTTMKWKLES